MGGDACELRSAFRSVGVPHLGHNKLLFYEAKKLGGGMGRR